MTYDDLLERLRIAKYSGASIANAIALEEMLAVIDAAEYPVQVERCEAHGGVVPVGYVTGSGFTVSHCGCRNVYVLREAMSALRAAWEKAASRATVTKENPGGKSWDE